MNSHRERAVDNAISVLEEARHTGEIPLLVPPPPSPWKELRGPLYVISAAFTVLSLSVVILVVLLLRADVQSSRQDDQNLCSQVLNAQVSQSAANSRYATSALLAEIVRQLLNPPDPEDPEVALAPLRDRLSDLDEANAADRESLAARDGWLASGRPVPCPVTLEE